MPTARIQCIHCNAFYTVDSALLNKRVKCKNCGEVFHAALVAEKLVEAGPPNLPLGQSPSTSSPSPPHDDLDDLLTPQPAATSALESNVRSAESAAPRIQLPGGQKRKASLEKAMGDPWVWALLAGTILSIVVLPIVGAHVLAMLVLMVCGLGLLAWGVMNPPKRRRSTEAADDYGGKGTAGISAFTVVLIVARAIDRAMRNDKKAADVADTATIVGWTVGIIGLIVFLFLLWKIRKQGLHRVVSFAYLAAVLVAFGMAPPVSHALMAGMKPRNAGIGQFTLLPVETTLPDKIPVAPKYETFQPGIERAVVRLGIHSIFPGHEDTLRIYRPTGSAGKKLPCVFIAPAGTPLIWGNKHGDSDSAEHIPYVKAGFIVIAFDLDGPLSHPEAATEKQIDAAVTAFVGSKAGLVNARNAIDFAVRDVSEVDPNRLYSAGHSSAGTQALLLQAVDGRIKASVAYAPCTDVEAFIAPFLKTGAAAAGQLRDFARIISPKNHAAEIDRPTFLFCASDDSRIQCSDVEAFSHSLPQGQFKRVPTGEHYQAMIDQGIPAGIQFLCGLSKQLPPAAKQEGMNTVGTHAATPPPRTNSVLESGARIPLPGPVLPQPLPALPAFSKKTNDVEEAHVPLFSPPGFKIVHNGVANLGAKGIHYYRPVNSGGKKLPVVFVPPSGLAFDAVGGMHSERMTEQALMEWAKAGFLIAAFDLNEPHPCAENYVQGQIDLVSMGGVLEARTAVAYTLQMVPEVDSTSLLSMGVSAGGTVALMLAATEPQIKGCLVFDPYLDLTQGIVLPQGQSRRFNDDVEDIQAISPLTHASQITCPVMIVKTGQGRPIAGLKEFVSKQGDCQTGTLHELHELSTGLYQGPPTDVQFLYKCIGVTPTKTKMAQRNHDLFAVPYQVSDVHVMPVEADLPNPLPAAPEFRGYAPGIEIATVSLYDTKKHGTGDKEQELPTGIHILRPADSAGTRLPVLFVPPYGGYWHIESEMPKLAKYAAHGFLVVAYDLSKRSPLYMSTEGSGLQMILSAMMESEMSPNKVIDMNTKGGLVESKNAIEYVLGQVAEADSSRMFSLGARDGGALALMLPVIEPRIAGVVVFHPVIDDSESQILANNHSAESEFKSQISPANYTKDILCPVMMIYTTKRGNTPVKTEHLTNFAANLANCKTLTYETWLERTPAGNQLEPRTDLKFLFELAGLPVPTVTIDQLEDEPRLDQTIQKKRSSTTVPLGGPRGRNFPLPVQTRATLPPAPNPVAEPSANTPPPGKAAIHFDDGDAWGDWRSTESSGMSSDIEWTKQSREWTISQYSNVLAKNDEAALEKVLWHPGLSRPSVGQRWGVGFIFIGNSSPPSMKSQLSLERYTGTLGLELGKRLQSLQLANKFGSLEGLPIETMKYVQLIGSGTKGELLATARGLGIEMLCLVELKSEVLPGSKRQNTLMTVRFVDAFGDQQAWASPVLSSEKAQGGKGAASFEWLQKFSDALSEKFVPQPAPADAAKQVEEDFNSWQKKKPKNLLAAVLEIRVAQQRKWITSAKAKELMELALGADVAAQFLAADDSAREKLLAKMLPRAE